MCSVMPYVPHFIAMPFVLRVRDFTARDVISAKCFCGAGPFTIAPHWLHSRHTEHEFLRRIMDHMKCPACGAKDTLMWQTFRAEPSR